MSIYRSVVKPIVDLVASLIGLLILSPIFIIICILLFISNKGTPFFLQDRGGIHKSVFKIIKFKTMNNKKDPHGELLPDKMRMTKLGSFIRNASLDELPQLINVIKGDMSLIGPRPMLAEYLKIYDDHQSRRLEVKPGITGWAQVNGRNILSFNQKFELDIWYINHLSFMLDIRILFLTLFKVFKTSNINQEGDLEVTADNFNGKN